MYLLHCQRPNQTSEQWQNPDRQAMNGKEVQGYSLDDAASNSIRMRDIASKRIWRQAARQTSLTVGSR